MEYLDGITLAERLNTGPIPWKEALPVALDLCEGLRLIHAEGIIHRDLKAGNIMLCEQGKRRRTVLMDFGLAQNLEKEAAGRGSFSGGGAAWRIAGTPEYMAPEQFEGGAVSPATDIYALGIVLYEMVTGVHPYAGPTPIAAAIRRARQPKLPSRVGAQVPPQWDRVIACCLQYEPAKRFQTAEEAGQALRPGPANLRYLHKDRPWVFLAACAALLGMLAWGGFKLWQVRRYYRPSAQARQWYGAGVAALREGNYMKAKRALEVALEEEPHYVMAHARLAEAWADLDFEGNAQREMLIAAPDIDRLAPLDRMYMEAIQATITRDYAHGVEEYKGILAHLPPQDKAAGYVDLGMAYERQGDPTHALENYALAARLDGNDPASYMHTAVLQTRLHHVPEADRAFQRAQAIFSTEMNQEGLAELDYERGLAANSGGDPATAERYLEKALEEAKAIPSIQLQIRTLTQLSGAAYVSNHYEQAVRHAEEAIHLAQANQLDIWAADGFVRLASAELQQGHLQKAEDAAQEALQFSHQNQQRRIEAGANLTLASIMNQQRLPDQVIAPAQSALNYYTQNGFFRNAASASLLLIRAQRDKGEYSRALESGKAFQELATRSGIHQLVALSEEVNGSIYLEMEQYPYALEHFQRAQSVADGVIGKAIQAVNCANALWRLGRYSEAEAMLQSVPTTETFAPQTAKTRADLLLSRMKYREVDVLAQKSLASYPTMVTDLKRGLELDQVLAESHLHLNSIAAKHLQELADSEKGDLITDRRPQLSIAEAYLALSMAHAALDVSAKLPDHFAATNQLDSELRSLAIAASASKMLNDPASYELYSKKMVDILDQLKQTWGSLAVRSYLSRPDLQALMCGVGAPALFER